MSTLYPKGSEWRKWDLQTQTILDDNYISLSQYYLELKATNPVEYEQYIAKVGGEPNALLFDSKAYFNDATITKEERCNNYVRNYFSFLECFNPDLECIGITDHNYFDDCLLDVFIEYAKHSRFKIIPGVEINCTGIHLLLFFQENLYNKESFSAGIHAFLIKSNINNRINENRVLTTTSIDIKTILDEVKKNSGIIIYPHCNSNNGLFQERTATDRTHLADIFNYQKINLLQSQNHRSSISVSQYIKQNSALSAKYCTHISSDSRSLRDLGKPDQDGNYLWIKADPTFEGLKQIMYEPEHRIFVGPHKPEEKKSYFIIDKVRFLDNTRETNFCSDQIELNQNLTTIIGGKSAGKSLLLYYIAKTIDRKEVFSRTAESGLSIKYDFDASNDFNFEVTWRDGQCTTLKKYEEDSNEKSVLRKILYIPQRYLNTLSEENIKSRDALNEFVLNVILQDSTIRQKYEETLQEIKSGIKSITSEINELFSDREDIVKIEDELKQSGDENGIKSYLLTLQKQSDSLKTKSGLSDEQLQEYDDLMTKEKDIDTLVSNLEEDKKTIKDYGVSLIEQFNEIHSVSDEFEAYLNDDEIKNQFKKQTSIFDAFRSSADSVIATLVKAIDDKLNLSKTELTKIHSQLSPLLAKVKLQTEFQEKIDSIKKEEQKLNEISIKKNSLKTLNISYKKKNEGIINSYKQIFVKYEKLQNEFKSFENKFGDITLGINIGFNETAFNTDVIKEYINRNDLKRVIIESEWGNEFVYKYDSTKHVQNITTVFDGLISGSINTVKGRSKKDAIAKLLENYFYIDFRIFYKNDFLDKMSPGKKGFVLLQLLINLSNEEWPILLDQPEDDLDNRSVYDDLVSFLKKKKSQRQIIIVTHNPNLVVGADSEEIIVANQSGQEIGRENKKFRFEYVSGALENTFEIDMSQESAILFRKGIRQHVCEILEGGKEAFLKREQKYNFPE